MANGDGFQIPAGTIVVKTAVDLQDLDRDLRKVEKRGQEAGAATGENFGSGFGQAVDEGGAKEAADELGKSVEGAGEKAEEARGSFESTDEKVEDFKDTAEGTAKSVTGLAVLLGQRLAAGATRAGSAIVSVAVGGLDLLGDGLQGLGDQLAESADEMENLGLAAEVTGRSLSAVGIAVGKLAQALTGLRLVVGAGTLGFLAKATKEANEFEKSFNRVQTLLDQTEEELQPLRREVSGLAADMGVTAEVANGTFYQVISAMPDVAEDPTKALEVLEVALQAGATGFTEASTAAEAITGVLNAFQLEAEEARRVSDALFAAQNRGVLTFGQIASEINKVSGITNALEGDFEDLLAIVATTTGELGQSVPKTFTQVQGVIRAVVSPTSQAQEAWKNLEGTSEALSAELIREEGLIGAIERIVEVTEGNPEAISQIIPRANAQALVIALADRMDRLKGSLDSVSETSDETAENFETMTQELSEQAGIIKEEWVDAFTQVGLTLDEVTEGFVLKFVKAIRWANGLLTDFIAQGAISVEVINDLTDAFAFFGSGQFEKGVENLEAARDVIVGEILQWTPEAFGAEDFLRNEILPRLGLSDQQIAEIEERSETVRQLARDAIGIPGDEAIAGAESFIEGQTPDPTQEATEQRIEDVRQLGKIRAQQARMAGRSEEEVQQILDETQRKVNRIVEAQLERMKNAGATRDALAAVASEWERIPPRAEEVEGISGAVARNIERAAENTIDQRDAMASLADVARAAKRQIQEMEDAEPPELPEGVEREQFPTSAAEDAKEALEELLTSGREVSEEEIQEVLDRFGVNLKTIAEEGGAASKRLARLALEALGFSVEADQASDESEQLAETLSKIASVASGIIQAADAMGELDDETRAALQSAQSLIQAGSQIASGNIAAGVAQGAGALANIVASAIGASDREKVIQENTEALRALRTDLQTLQEALSEIPGDVLAVRDELQALVDRIPEDFGPLPEGALPEDRPFGTEDEDFIGEPEATKGEVEAALGGLGLSFEELQRLANRLGVSIEHISKAMNEGEASADGVRQEFIDLNEEMKELKLDRLFEGFSGQMKELKDRFELFDIEDPLEQLEMIRQKFLEFADIPPALEEALGGADLSTEGGRARAESAIQRLFEMLAAGELSPEDLGGLDPSEFRDMLTRMEGLLDEGMTEAGDEAARSFSVRREVTEQTATRMVGVLTTMDVRLAQIVTNTGRLLNLQGGEGIVSRHLSAGPRLPGPDGPEGEDGPLQPEDLVPPPEPVPNTPTFNQETTFETSVDVGGVTVEGSGDVAEEAAEKVSRAIERRLGEKLRQYELSVSKTPTRKS